VTGDDAGPWADAQPVTSTAPALRGPAPLATGRRARGLTFLGVVAALLATTVLAVLGVVPVPAVAAPVAALGAVLVWMRRGAQAEQAARREASRRQRVQRAGERAETARRTSGLGQTGRVARAERSTQDALAPGGGVPTDAAATAGDGSADAYAGLERDSRREDLYDIQAVEAGEIGQVAAAAAPAPTSPTPAPVPPTGLLVDEDDIPLTWDPVPVPRPTYTMKAMAQRHAPAPVEQGVPPELADAAYDEPVRRVAGA
jgi:hypothetical protein